MKICKIIIKDFQQFKDFEIDLTHPETGEPLEKVCFIGSNGTGKTTILKLLKDFLDLSSINNPNILLKIKVDNKFYYSHKGASYSNLRESVENSDDWLNELQPVFEDLTRIFHNINNVIFNENFQKLEKKIPPFKKDKLYSLIYQPSEAPTNNYIHVSDVPHTNLNNAFFLFKKFRDYHEISSEKIVDFWQILIYHIKKREQQFLIFQNQEDNLDKTIRQVKNEFDTKHPKILDAIAVLWNPVLEKVGLAFDVENAKTPTQLNDKLEAYIRTIQTKERIPYNQLSTGIRNFIFKLGHIFSLYFNRKIDTGFLLIDNPEDSLSSDFLYNLIDIYTEIAHNTQIFMATHNPIVAAQFEPYERFILEFNDQGYVEARRGTVPAGSTPNDILIKDFGIRSILGKKGVEMWERYIELKILIPLENDPAIKLQMIQEFSKIGTAYNFGEEEQ